MTKHISEREERTNHWRTLFGDELAHHLQRASWPELRLAICDPPSNALGVRLNTGDRVRLRAFVRLFETWYPQRADEPERVECVADLVALIRPRCRTLQEATVWLLGVDVTHCICQEVLVAMGPAPMEPPPVNVLLRHALRSEAQECWIADYRPQGDLPLDDETRYAFLALREVGHRIGLSISDWVLFDRQVARSVREAVDFGEVVPHIRAA